MDLAATLTNRDGMSTNVWGNPMWFVLHTLAMAFPIDDGDERRAMYRQFMESLGAVLPCGACRDNYAGNYRDAVDATHEAMGHGPYESRIAFIHFVWALHNMVNETLGKVSSPPSLGEVVRRFESFRAHCSQRHADDPDDDPDHTGCSELPPNRVGHKAQTFIHVRPRRRCDDKDASDHLTIDPACHCRPKTPSIRVVPPGWYRVSALKDEPGLAIHPARRSGRWLKDGLHLRTDAAGAHEEPLAATALWIDRGDPSGAVRLRPAADDAADMVGAPFLFLGEESN